MNRLMKYFVVSISFMMIVIAGCAGIAHAQGSRKDDIVFNALGRPMAGATVRVCTSTATGQPCSPLALVYSDSALTQALANPLSADGLGNYNFYASPGRYMIELSGPGITTKQIPNVILPSDPSTPTFTSVTTTSGISAFSLTLSGNLTVNGSTAVAGTLTVGGLPIPTANQDNEWTAAQRFKGPIPYRDITAYMPAGGCSSSAVPNDPNSNGTMTSGSAVLTLTNARDFKNGCGIAVVNAGPTSTITGPVQGCSITSVARAANIVTVTCAAAHNIPQGIWDHFMGIQVTGVTDASFNGTFDVATVADATHFTYAQTAGNASSGSGTATMQFGYAHGLAGSTTYNYKVSAVDALGGMSAASAAFTVTSANATLTTNNYNWINFGVGSTSDPRNQPQLVPHEWVIYSDKGLGGAYSCVGTAFTNAYTDFGLAMPCPVFAPATPPVTATPQVLNAIISSGGGTTSLTLSATASNGVTTQNVYHDETSFLRSCVNDDLAYRAGGDIPGSYGCLIPAGNYYFNGQMPTDNTVGLGTTIFVSGTLYFNVFPWYVSKNVWHIKGLGEGGSNPSFGHAFTSNPIFTSTSLGAAIVIRSAISVYFSGFDINSLQGHGIWVGSVAYLQAPSSYRFDDMNITELSGGAGAPLVFDSNVIGVWVNNSTLTPAPGATGLPAIWETVTNWANNVNCCMYFNDLSTVTRGVKFDAPGENGSGGGHNSFYFRNWVNESLSSGEIALIVHDNGPNAPGPGAATDPLINISLSNVNNSDPVNGPGAYGVFAEMGTLWSNSISGVSLDEVNIFGSLLRCGPNSTSICADAQALFGTVFNSALGGTWGGGLIQTTSGIEAGVPIFSKQAYAQLGSGIPAWAQVLPAPNQFLIASTGAGSLAAATYCMAVEGKDAGAGLTLPTNLLCQLVGASSSINLQWSQGSGSLNQAYNGFRIFFCSTVGSTCTPTNYFDMGGAGNPVSFTLTTTAGATAGVLAGTPTAYMSYLGWNLGCLYCVRNPIPIGGDFYGLSVGDPAMPSGTKLGVLGQFNIRGGLIRCQETTAPTGIALNALLWCDSTTHRWMMNNNNGTSVPIAGIGGTLVNGNAVKADANLNLVDAGGVPSLATAEYCGATTGATQACAKTVQTLPLIVWGDVLLNAATSQSITTLPFTDALYSCSGSDLTTPAGVVSFNTYASASVNIQESGGTNADHLRYMCAGH